MPIYEFEGKRPVIGASSYVHPDAKVIGDVVIGEKCYIGPGAVLRGDWGAIRVGDGSNVQENCVLHAGPDDASILGPDCHISHGSIIHGATLGRHVHVGMGGIIQDKVTIGDGCIVGSGCVVLARTDIPPLKVVVGVPGQVIADIDENREKASWEGIRLYQALPARYRESLRDITDQY